MKSKYFLRIVSLLALLVSLVPASNAGALPSADPPPADMFQLPWDLGIAWVAIDGIDNGTRRPLNSSHHYSVGGAIDFAPHNNMRKGEDTSRFWVAAAAAGTVVAKSFCHVKIDHGNGWTTEYQFLANIPVKTGDSVARNQRLGIIADGVRQPFCPGSSEPNVPHLHFMLRPTLINATMAGWEINYLPVLNKTTFLKHGSAVGLFKPLLNTFDQVQIVMRGPITWDTLYSGNVDAFRYERWSLTLEELNKFTLTATPTTSGLVPLILLLDANGNEIARNPGTLTSTQPAGSYFVQIQPQTGSGSYNLLLQRNDLPIGPYVYTTVTPGSVNVGQTTTATVGLNNVPAEGYTSAEFTCTYNSTLVQVSNIQVANLFGADPAVAINDPQNGSFIVAVAGSGGKKATADGTVFTFSLTGKQSGQTAVECRARVSKGDNVLTAIEFIPGSLTVLGGMVTPGPSPTTPVETPEPTFTPTPTTGTTPPAVCDKVQMVGDVTVPDGTVFPPGASFTKIWRLKNVGTCTWTTSYQIVFVSGNQMGAVSQSPFPTNVAPGQSADFSINMTAPSTPGSYRGYWMFKNASGQLFGMGAQADKPWWVDIRVSGDTATPGPGVTESPMPNTPTVLPSTCDRAEFIADINVPPGTVMSPGTQFTKTWRLKNIGPCDWTTSYQLVFFYGEQMGAISSVPFTQSVAVGQTVDISINMTAPNAPGSYRGYWMFRNSTGANFGIGPEAKEPWFVEITVSGPTLPPSLTPSRPPSSPTPTPTPDGSSPTPSLTPGGPTATPIPNTVYDFAVNACAATWFSGAGQLPCPGVDGDDKGFVLKLSNPRLETGAIDSRPGLLTFPQNVQNGYIQGFYPAFHVQDGDRFRSILNCEFGATNCYLAFRLDYQIGTEPIRTLWGPFLERYEGRYYTADVDLSSLAGKDVKFILTVISAGVATGDRALWVGPIIYRADSDPTPTPTPSSTPPAESPTPTFTASPTIPPGWLTFTNDTYDFRFQYPQDAQIVAGGTDNSTRINLPFVPGTNLSQKWLQMTVVENADPCRSPLASSSIPQSSEIVVINGITFLKETGEDGTAGHINKWTAYSTEKDNACVSLDFVLRAANPGVFPTPPPLYNEAAESLVFGQIVSTYQWLAGPGTHTPTPSQSATPTATQSAPVESPTPTATNSPDGTIIGKVIASKPVTVNLYTTGHVLVKSVTANPDGTFSLTAPTGTYTIAATASGFLSAEGSVTVNGGGTSTKSDITLLGGDIDGNDVIDQFDALTIGMSYNSGTPAEADLNNDGIINVLDLELLANNYRKLAPQPWN